MLFVYPVTAVYVESCTMFTRGGVYKVVKGAVGGGLAKLSVSALMFDYVLTGPISSVSAGQYLARALWRHAAAGHAWHSGHPLVFDSTTHPDAINVLYVLIAIGITIYFWRANIIGMHESSDKALRIMQLTTVMGVLMIGWSISDDLPAAHAADDAAAASGLYADQSGSDEGIVGGVAWSICRGILGIPGILVAFGHSLLAMSGEESLAQVNREIEAPKLKNLRRAGMVICIFALVLTTSISFLAVLIIPDGKRVITQVVTNGTANRRCSRENLVGSRLFAKGARRPYGRLGIADDTVHRCPRRADGDHTGSEVMVVDRAFQHVERDNGGYRDNLINGLVQYLAGPPPLRDCDGMFCGDCGVFDSCGGGEYEFGRV